MANANLASMFFDELKASVARAYDWPGFPIRRQIGAERIPGSLLERMPGTYRLGDLAGVITSKNDRLFISFGERDVMEIFAKSATELFTPAFGLATFQWLEVDRKITGLKTSDGRMLQRVD